MAWLRHVVIDLIVTLFIVVATVLHLGWMRWLVLGYTVLMIALKIVALVGNLGGVLRTGTSVPTWFFHLLYAVNIVAAAWAAVTWADTIWWGIAVGWLLLWILSVMVEARARRALAARPRPVGKPGNRPTQILPRIPPRSK